MIKKLAIGALLCFATFAADQPAPSVISANDGNQYKLVKAEKQLSGGITSIAEYVRVGDKTGTRYAMNLTRKGEKPSFWKIKS